MATIRRFSELDAEQMRGWIKMMVDECMVQDPKQELAEKKKLKPDTKKTQALQTTNKVEPSKKSNILEQIDDAVEKPKNNVMEMLKKQIEKKKNETQT